MPKQINACLREVNLSTLMAAMIIETAIMSFIIQFLEDNHHPTHTPMLITKLKRSKALTPKLLIWSISFLSRSVHFTKNKS